MERFRPLFMTVTFGFLGAAFYLTYRPRQSPPGGTPGGATGGSATSRQSRSTIMTLNKLMLWAVTIIAIVFLFFPQVVTGLLAPGDEFTADMDRTVIAIEGMT